MDAGLLIPIVLFGCVFGVATVAILAKTFAQIICHWRDVSLKMRMVDAGYTAVEIEQVMRAWRGEMNTSKFEVPPVRMPSPMSKKMVS